MAQIFFNNYAELQLKLSESSNSQVISAIMRPSFYSPLSKSGKIKRKHGIGWSGLKQAGNIHHVIWNGLFLVEKRVKNPT